jgi:hypothetical protein
MFRFHRSKPVTGAAHTNWSMFGSRGPLLAPEGDSPGGAAPAPAPAGDPPTPAPSPAPAPAEIVFTPEQQAVINKLVGQARVEGRNAAVKAPAPPAPVPSPPPEPKLTLEQIATELAETKMRARFDKQALRRGFDDAAADDLFDLYRVQKPADDETWFAEREKRLGLKRPAQPSTPAAPEVTLVPNTAPISDRGSPAPAGAVGWKFEMNNPVGMSKAARDQMDAELGREKAVKMRLEASREQASRLRVTVKPQG